LYQDPAIKWFQEEFGVPLQVIHEFEGDQAPETQELIRKIVESLDTWTLAGLYSLAESCTSIITALALMNRKMTVEVSCSMMHNSSFIVCNASDKYCSDFVNRKLSRLQEPKLELGSRSGEMSQAPPTLDVPKLVLTLLTRCFF
jgi:hypothetical protein